MQEIWKKIINYSQYEVSNLGKVRRNPPYFKSLSGLLKFDIGKKGYYRVPLCKEGSFKKFLLHRLVGLHFILNPKNLPEINHKDGNKGNNKVNNLEWSTCKNNILHAFKIGLRNMPKGTDCSWHKLTEAQVLDIRERWKIKAYNMRELAEYFKVNKTTIWEIIHRKIWRHI